MDATPAGFESFLAEDIAWRKVELSVLSKALSSAASRSTDSPESRALSRALVALAYAHWEGYAKNALDGYCRFLTKRRLRLTETNDALLLTQGLRLLKRLQSGNREVSTSLARLMRGETDERLSLVRPEMSDTKSNLRFDRLEELFESFGLDMGPFKLLGNLIDVRLCDRRNSVAHGRAEFPEAQDTLDLKNEVVSLMEKVRTVLIGAVSNRSYFLNTSSTLEPNIGQESGAAS